MIPIDTPPGTDIVCVCDSRSLPQPPGYLVANDTLSGLRLGAVYTVRDYVEICGEVCVRLQEIVRPLNNSGIEAGYLRSRFRLLEKPVELYSLLERAPVKETV
jgi:hypothetical protein